MKGPSHFIWCCCELNLSHIDGGEGGHATSQPAKLPKVVLQQGCVQNGDGGVTLGMWGRDLQKQMIFLIFA